MRKLVERVREKPIHKRNFIAMSTSIGITAFVFLLWLVGVIFSPNSIIADQDKKDTQAASPAKTLQGQVNSLFGE